MCARPSGSGNSFNIDAESFRDKDHAHAILDDAQLIVDKAPTEMEKL